MLTIRAAIVASALTNIALKTSKIRSVLICSLNYIALKIHIVHVFCHLYLHCGLDST